MSQILGILGGHLGICQLRAQNYRQETVQSQTCWQRKGPLLSTQLTLKYLPGHFRHDVPAGPLSSSRFCHWLKPGSRWSGGGFLHSGPHPGFGICSPGWPIRLRPYAPSGAAYRQSYVDKLLIVPHEVILTSSLLILCKAVFTPILTKCDFLCFSSYFNLLYAALSCKPLERWDRHLINKNKLRVCLPQHVRMEVSCLLFMLNSKINNLVFSEGVKKKISKKSKVLHKIQLFLSNSYPDISS